jgi:transcriptional regulator with GAF, ATPase, and Fis domain
VPPLRDRDDDVIRLARHFLEKTCSDFARPPMQLTRSQAEMLRRYSWPGNVRELKNVIERAVILSPRNVLRLDLSMSNAGADARNSGAAVRPAEQLLTEIEMREFQKKNLVAALEQANWKVSGPGGAADLLGVKSTTLTDRIRMFGIRKP